MNRFFRIFSLAVVLFVLLPGCTKLGRFIRLLEVSSIDASYTTTEPVSIVGTISYMPEWTDCLKKLRKGDNNKYKAFISVFGIQQENIFMCMRRGVEKSSDNLFIVLADAPEIEENKIVATKMQIKDGDQRIYVRQAEFRVPTGKTFARLSTYKAISLLGTNGVIAKIPIILESGRYQLFLAMYGPWLSDPKIVRYLQTMLPIVLEHGTGISYANNRRKAK